jgi:hypothetical protein
VVKLDEAKPMLAQTNEAKNPSAVGGESAAGTDSGGLRPPLANARSEVDAATRTRR